VKEKVVVWAIFWRHLGEDDDAGVATSTQVGLLAWAVAPSVIGAMLCQ